LSKVFKTHFYKNFTVQTVLDDSKLKYMTSSHHLNLQQTRQLLQKREIKFALDFSHLSHTLGNACGTRLGRTFDKRERDVVGTLSLQVSKSVIMTFCDLSCELSLFRCVPHAYSLSPQNKCAT
jgi:hypothetical protein